MSVNEVKTRKVKLYRLLYIKLSSTSYPCIILCENHVVVWEFMGDDQAKLKFWFIIINTTEYLALSWKSIDDGVVYTQSMKIVVISNLSFNVILLLLYMELCCCIVIDRESRDTSDSFDINNCNEIIRTFSVKGRCKCDSPGSSILSTNTGQLACIKNRDIGSSKYTWILLYLLLFSWRKTVTMLSPLF